MTLAEIWNALAAVIAEIPRSGLLVAVIAALAAGWIGAMMVRSRIPLGRLVSTASTIALVAILVTVVLQLSRFDSRMDFAMPEMGMPQQVVEGAQTRIPMAPDGHFWLRADVNGVPTDFMVDTGATLTAVSGRVADAAGLEPRRGGIPIRLNTANGSISAQVTSIDELRFGTITARGLDAVTAPNLGETNVIGMNLLSRLKSWRVEDNVLILVPNNPQPPAEQASGSY